uniref:hypothetical protein n=1 Tax=Methylobacterium sp. B34 TaxID=95563 RepID=UPI000346CC01|nr:hypothetical protein [Methylobacterium sp. B34]
MTYTIQQLAPGSYDILQDGALVASLVREVSRGDAVRGWLVELLEEASPTERPAPFTAQQHVFSTRAAALEWLGIQGADATAEPTG